MAANKPRVTRTRLAIVGMVLAMPGLAAPAVAQQGYGYAGQAPSRDTGLTSLHDALSLTPSQEPAWAAYAAQMGTGAQARGRQQAAQAMMPSLDAPRRMDLIEAEMRQELSDLHARSQALKALYGVLTPTQRQTFDQRTLPQQPPQ